MPRIPMRETVTANALCVGVTSGSDPFCKEEAESESSNPGKICTRKEGRAINITPMRDIRPPRISIEVNGSLSCGSRWQNSDTPIGTRKEITVASGSGRYETASIAGLGDQLLIVSDMSEDEEVSTVNTKHPNKPEESSNQQNPAQPFGAKRCIRYFLPPHPDSTADHGNTHTHEQDFEGMVAAAGGERGSEVARRDEI